MVLYRYELNVLLLQTHLEEDRVPSTFLLHADLPSRGDLFELGKSIVAWYELWIAIDFLLLKLGNQQRSRMPTHLEDHLKSGVSDSIVLQLTRCSQAGHMAPRRRSRDA